MRHYTYVLLIAIAMYSCKSSNPVTPPGKSALVFPVQNSVCVSGTVLSTTKSTVLFRWNASSNTDTYQLILKNLVTDSLITQVVSDNQASVTISRGTPYSWYVVSVSAASTQTSQSDTWKFYNSGPGIVSYAPFPATLTSPGFNQTITANNGMINLTWIGSSVDNNIVGYDIYLGTTATPTLYKSNVTDMFLNNIPVTSGLTYYWQVITKDSKANTSYSTIYQFTVK